jgi:XRE family aerobic/anaerobic benzoate catabolism transcriptional regulator
MFALYGQAAYRKWERRCLDALIERHRDGMVLATGGSLVSEPATFERLLSACFTVWLKAAPDEHMTRVIAQGDFRPMAQNKEAMADLRRILAVRTPLYLKADVAVDTAGRAVDDSLAALLAAVGG